MGDLIRNTPTLKEACAKVRAGGVLVLDTEFVWRRTYRPLLSLVQFADAKAECFALDCLAGLDPAPLGELIADPSIVKVLHAAQQDLEHLWHYTGAVPANVFDTQVAAAFAGFQTNIGLQKVLIEALNVGLPKTETLTDWSQRPLTARQIDYALDDVRYLDRLRLELQHRADELGTRAWLDEEIASLDAPTRFVDIDPRDAWKKVKVGRSEECSRRDFAFLRELAAVREERAREWNLPKAWVTEDESLVGMAKLGRPVGNLHFAHRLKSGAQRDALERDYLRALAAAAAVDKAEYPENPHPYYIREVREAAENAFKWMQTRAAELHVDPGMVANRATVVAFINDEFDDSNPLATGWRYAAIGQDMIAEFAVE